MTHHPAADATDWGGRLPRNETLDLDNDQQAAVGELHRRAARWAEHSGFAATDDRGGLIGPFNAFALRPGQGRGFNRWVANDQQNSSLSAPIREVVILTVGTAWDADYEIYAHVLVARSVGLSETVIEGIRTGSTDGFTAAERAAHRFVDELVRNHRVPDDVYAAAEAEFGRDGVLDMVHLTGMYLATSALLNAFEVPAPEIPPAP
ncbi:carboxymuconolactone decarboxylase family protein [Actinomycetospora termitidis]|uniref:Carboxymuconolactone decarboxylase family protein n=1 Tax=Actinomycetospora termitidis TaxID=3053470 RepID=A0ABT7MFR9_9PSEU|nr:carboxymuconolactone decarboxylase family protein [Actinomycetospora sp. Odt1-22]MDL5159520.1 carboxymuconolactone decarboxylase family protein [Actinomycetospora sp. Odt1-22]